MDKQNNFSFRILLIALIVIAIVFAFSNRDIYRETQDSINLYNEVFKNIFSKYVEPVKPEKFVEKSLELTLEQLDPYTELLNKEQQESIKLMTEGEYGGVGMRISVYNDTITVISPIVGSPSFRAGIQPGDQILMIDTINAVGLGLSEAARKIRGKVGTQVKLLIRRPGVFDKMEYVLRREKIKIENISYSGYIDDGIYYIKLIDFSSGAARQIREDIIKNAGLEKIKGLVLDLRGNPGGLLKEAIRVAEIFTNPGDTLLITRGRNPESNGYYVSKREPLIDNNVKLAVLIDRGSASASEIVAGVVQDLDRGVILGNSSFGKGLVQSVVSIDRKHILKITTAKYYTPSGRLIQKPNFIKDPTIVDFSEESDTVFYSRHGRKLPSHGGIHPDIEVSNERTLPIVQGLWRENLFYEFALHYKSKLNQIPVDLQDLQLDDNILIEFRKYVKERGFDYTFDEEKEMRKLEKKLKENKNLGVSVDFSQLYKRFEELEKEEWEKSEEQIRLSLKAELGMLIGGLSGRVAATLQDDKVVQKAIEVLKNSGEYATVLGFKNE
ncbi:MAG: S41 family peptidase [Candidatus Marinimicrobia bacterium]|nr:S41 family peptidase [Candidatus Neomarinimicrobiota bacterium]